MKYLYRFLSNHVKGISLFLTILLLISGITLIGFGVYFRSKNESWIPLVLGGITLLNGLPLFLRSIRDEQVKYSYDLIKDWHSLMEELNSKSLLFKNTPHSYKDDCDALSRKTTKDDFQRLLDHMSLILFSIRFERTHNPDKLLNLWRHTFELHFSEVDLAHYLWREEGFRETIRDDDKITFDRIFKYNANTILPKQ